MTEIDSLLTAIFHRRSCPAAEMLGNYYLGRLSPGQRLAVAQHLRECPHCTRELALYAATDEAAAFGGLVAEAKDALRGLIGRVLWAIPVTDVPAAPALRGEPGARQIYRAGEVEVELESGPATSGYRRHRLLGRLQPAGTAKEIALWDDATLLAAATPDSQGFFAFDRLKPGLYHLCLRGDDTEVWLAITVDG